MSGSDVGHRTIVLRRLCFPKKPAGGEGASDSWNVFVLVLKYGVSYAHRVGGFMQLQGWAGSVHA